MDVIDDMEGLERLLIVPEGIEICNACNRRRRYPLLIVPEGIEINFKF